MENYANFSANSPKQILIGCINNFSSNADLAMLCWMDADALDPTRKYLIKHTTRTTKAVIEGVDYKLDIGNLQPDHSVQRLAMNDIGAVRFKVREPLMVDAYRDEHGFNRSTGGFIVIDETSNHTVGAGMILPEDTHG